ncbi:MAG: SPFH domain-containing protein [Planctomycetota bacterium]
MVEDHLAYKRAISVSIVGLLIQLTLGVLLLVYSRLGTDPAALTGSLLVLLGAPVWLALAVVFQQHKLERLEAMEIEAFESSTAARSTVFERVDPSQHPQAAKLVWMHKWFLPAASLIIAASQIVVGVVRYSGTREATDIETFVAPPQGGWAIALGVSLAVVGFVLARFVAGMGKQKAWALLNAGAGVAVAAALAGLLLAAAHFLALALGQETLLRNLPLVMAVVLVVLGGEMVINFVLNIYRPRAAGEVIRPAFDSRILAFAAAPDRIAESISDAINYQLGFDVSGSWFYKLLSRRLASLLVLGVAVTWALSLFTVIEPHERGILRVNGEFRGVRDSGLVIKPLPWPFATIEKRAALSETELIVGFDRVREDPTEPILWTGESGDRNDEMIVLRSTADDVSEELSVAIVSVPVRYTVRDLEKYVLLAQDGSPADPDEHRRDLLRSIASREITGVMAALALPEVLGRERRGLGVVMHERIQQAFEDVDAGVSVTAASLSLARPPVEVGEAFEQVIAAEAKQAAAIEAAGATRIRQLASVAGSAERAEEIIEQINALDALTDQQQIDEQELRLALLIADGGGNAAQRISEARAERWERHMAARARFAQKSGLLMSYRASPLAYRAISYTSALRQSLANARVYITPDNAFDVTINQEEVDPGITGFGPGLDETPEDL